MNVDILTHASNCVETFPDIKGFKIFHVPLSPRAAPAR
jgi:hypothetical protein